MADWTETLNLDRIDVIRLLRRIEEKPVLWHKQHEDYGNANSQTEAWNDIAREFVPDFDNINEDEKDNAKKILAKNWHTLLGVWSRWSRGYARRKKRGLAAKFYGKFVYQKYIAFVKEPDMMEEPVESGEPNTENHSDSAEETSENSSDAANNEERLSSDRKRRARKRQFDRVEAQVIERLQECCDKNDANNPHLSFFTSCLPTLGTLDTGEVLEFYHGVLKLLTEIVSRPKVSYGMSNEDSSGGRVMKVDGLFESVKPPTKEL